MDELTVVMLSGAGLPARIWDKVRADLPDGTRGVVPQPPRRRATLSEYAAAAVQQAGPGPLVVVAHSAGGVVAAQLLALFPGRVLGLLGVSAVVPSPGRSFAATMPFPIRALLPVVLRVVGTRPPRSAIRSGLGAGLPDDVVEALVRDLVPESRALFLQRTAAFTLPAVRHYLLTTQDREVSPAVQRRSAAVLQAQTVHQLATGHLSMIEDPAGVGRAVRALLTAVTAAPNPVGPAPRRPPDGR